MKLKMRVLLMIARLSWGQLFLNPLMGERTRRRLFPPPIIFIYKKSLADYFFRN